VLKKDGSCAFMAHGPYDDFSRNGEKLCKLLKKGYYNRKTPR
jgi:hypothetical protein